MTACMLEPGAEDAVMAFEQVSATVAAEGLSHLVPADQAVVVRLPSCNTSHHGSHHPCHPTARAAT